MVKPFIEWKQRLGEAQAKGQDIGEMAEPPVEQALEA